MTEQHSSHFEESFVKFTKHIPRILRKQILSDFVNQLVESNSASTSTENGDSELSNTMVEDPIDMVQETTSVSMNHDPKSCCRPTIERFHGTLLFVDISGFTILSQKLTIDRLRSFINAYFKRLIDIVHKYDGEVIKFAGDALFIIWQTKVNSLDDENFHEKAAEGVRSALACGMEINRTCSNYKVQLSEQKAYNSDLIKNIKESEAGMLNHSSGDASFRKTKSIAANQQQLSQMNGAKTEENVAYLNVHSGLSVGVLASIDVGFGDRWEYLLLGSPLQDVAICEGEAGQGELVISAVAHKFLHVPSRQDNIDQVEVCESFGCVPLPSGCFKVTKFPHKSHHIAKISNDSHDDMEDEVAFSSIVLKDNGMELMEVKKIVYQYLQVVSNDTGQLSKLIEFSLLDDILRHVHHVSRGNYYFQCLPRKLEYCGHHLSTSAEQQLMASEGSGSDKHSPLPKKTFVDKIRDGIGTKFFHLKQQFNGGKNVRLAIDDNLLLSELREVIVMFINLHLPAIELEQVTTQSMTSSESNSEDEIFSTSRIDNFHFLKRSKGQLKQDRAILCVIQSCMKTMADSMKRHGGQLRQFIIDDKGSVGIGTWGLKGSMSNDVAADALQCARDLVISMQDIGVPVSIGLTSGQVYCGLVGSPTRHEFAVMGPSVNLSARLMGKCNANEILCDAVIRNRDRAHLYVPFAKLNAKGYAQPVETFRPVFQQGSTLFKKAPTLKQLSQALSKLDINVKARIATTVESDDPEQETRVKKLQKVSRAIGMLQVANKVTNGTRVHKRRRKLRASHIISAGTKRICGRDEQIALIIRKISPNEESVEDLAMNIAIIDTISNLSVVSKNYLDDSGQRFFSPQSMQSKVIIVAGSTGIGKSFISSNVTYNMLKLAVTRKYWNVLVYSNIGGPNISRMIEPFSSWKSIFLGILADFHNHSNGGGSTSIADNDAFRYRRTSNNVSGTRSGAVNSLNNILAQEKRKQALNGFHDIVPFLPDHLRNKKSLMDCISSIFGEESDEASTLVGSQRITATFELLVTVLHIIRDQRQCILFFHMENLHEMDVSSLRLMKILWESMTGVILLCTRTNTTATVAQSKRNILESNNADENEICSLFFSNEPVNSTVTIIELENLSREATFALTEETLRYYEIHECSGKVLDQVYTVSGGNPLYAFEMAKALGQSYRQLMLYNQQQAVSKSASKDEHEHPNESDRGYTKLSTGTMDPIDHIIQNLHISRIEEVIHFRFDQLSTTCQYLLKFISVACANGYHASLPLLAHMVSTSNIAALTELFSDCNNQEDVMLEVVKLLEEVFLIDVFLVLAPMKLHFTDREVLLLDDMDSSNHTLSAPDLLNVEHESWSEGNSMIYSSSMGAWTAGDDEGNMHEHLRKSKAGTNHSSTKSGGILDQINHENVANFCIYFDVELERKSIYDIMLDEQKMSLHENIATFMDYNPPTEDHHDELQAHLFEEGFHWENGKVWYMAMVCYYHSGMMLDKMGLSADSRRHLLMSYMMFCKMRFEADVMIGMPATAETANAVISDKSSIASTGNDVLDRFQVHFNKMLGQGDDKEARVPNGNDDSVEGALLPLLTGVGSPSHSFLKASGGESGSSRALLRASHLRTNSAKFGGVAKNGKKAAKRSDFYHLFGGDCSLMHICLQMLFRLAHSCYKLDVETVIVSKLLEEAMEIMSVVKIDQLVEDHGNDRRSSVDMVEIPVMSKNASQRLFVKEITDAKHFRITNPSVCFPILMSILMLYYTKKIVLPPTGVSHDVHGEDVVGREAVACSLFMKLLSIAKCGSLSSDAAAAENVKVDSPLSFSSSKKNNAKEIHQVIGHVLRRHLLQAQGKLSESIELMDQTKALYSFEEFHTGLIDHYGFDVSPQCFAMHLQVCLLLGDTKRVQVFQEMLLDIHPKITHLDTLMSLSLSLSIALVVGQEFESSYRVFQHYLQIETQQSMVFSQFRPYSKIPWLMIMMAHEEQRLLKNDTSSVSLQDEIVKLLDIYLPDIIAKKYMIFPFSDRKNIFYLATFSGFAIEYACAQIMLMYAKYLLRMSHDGKDSNTISTSHNVALLCKQYLEVADEYLWYCLKSCVGDEEPKTLMFNEYLALVGRIEVNIFHLHYFDLLHPMPNLDDNHNSISMEDHQRNDRIKLQQDVIESVAMLEKKTTNTHDMKFAANKLEKLKLDLAGIIAIDKHEDLT